MTMQRKISGKAWRDTTRKAQTEGEEVQMPSGNWARVRNIPLSLLLAHPDMTDSLTPIAAEIAGITSNASNRKTAKDVLTFIKQQLGVVEVITKLALIEPRVVDDPQSDDEIAYSDVEDVDRFWLMELLMKSARELQSFCQEQTRLMADVAAKQDVQPAAVGSDPPAKQVA
jgi:hypothetical protein